MKIINDIRLYKSSDIDNHMSFANKSLNIAVSRVVMKLREQQFSLGEFDHLYVNFTTCIPEDKIELVDKIDSYHPWYRYCNIGVDKHDYEKLNTDYVFFAIKDNCDMLRRENFKNPDRQDEYGVSVISIQFSRGSINHLSIKNRYNHTVDNPDCTFNNNLDNII